MHKAFADFVLCQPTALLPAQGLLPQSVPLSWSRARHLSTRNFHDLNCVSVKIKQFWLPYIFQCLLSHHIHLNTYLFHWLMCLRKSSYLLHAHYRWRTKEDRGECSSNFLDAMFWLESDAYKNISNGPKGTDKFKTVKSSQRRVMRNELSALDTNNSLWSRYSAHILLVPF